MVRSHGFIEICVRNDKGVEYPGFCLNGSTCQRQWTSARCHCAPHFQGEGCDTCVAGTKVLTVKNVHLVTMVAHVVSSQ